MSPERARVPAAAMEEGHHADLGLGAMDHGARILLDVAADAGDVAVDHRVRSQVDAAADADHIASRPPLDPHRAPDGRDVVAHLAQHLDRAADRHRVVGHLVLPHRHAAADVHPAVVVMPRARRPRQLRDVGGGRGLRRGRLFD